MKTKKIESMGFTAKPVYSGHSYYLLIPKLLIDSGAVDVKKKVKYEVHFNK